MRGITCAAIILCIAVIFMAPVQAFSADELTLDVRKNGDTQVALEYSLSWVEYIAVYLHIADPATELRSALEKSLNRQVSVSSAGTRSADFTVYNLASVHTADNSTTLVTPGLSFDQAGTVLDDYWFSSLVKPDFSPRITTVRFPDGFSTEFTEASAIPPVIHTLEG
ncbi:MAG: hypothetical protein LUQ25_05520 [Methanoregulaceae archaeon]|nr:hypothetical protein [Methanoregulaceae archaeon]